MRPSVAESCSVSCVSDAVGLSNVPPRLPIWRSFYKTPINGLLCSGRPAAIFRGIAKIVVDAFNCKCFLVSIFMSPFVKTLKARPFFADRNSPLTIIFKRRDRRTIASCAHLFPNAVKPRTALIMGDATGTKILQPASSASGGFPASQINPGCFSFVAAFAFAQPNRAAAGIIPALFQNGKFAKFLTGHFNQSWIFCHRSLYQDTYGVAI